MTRPASVPGQFLLQHRVALILSASGGFREAIARAPTSTRQRPAYCGACADEKAILLHLGNRIEQARNTGRTDERTTIR